MPIIKNAKKAERQSRKRTILNKRKKTNLEFSIRKFLKSKDAKTLSQIYSLVDKMAKKKTLHQNKAQRIKSRLAKLRRQKISTKKSS